MGKGAGPRSVAVAASWTGHRPPAGTPSLNPHPRAWFACLQTSVFAEPSVRFGGVLGSWLGTEQLVLSARDNSKVGRAGGGTGSRLAGLPA